MEQVLLADTFAPGRTEGNTELTQDPDSDKNSEADSSFDAEGDTFSWVITVTGVPPDGADETNKKFVTKESASDSFELFRIDLQVMWQDGDKEKSYEISTLVKPKK
ncbi:hypothetical protein [uncultured Desulfobacter sp.]|uniref:hypothetical protein n=1 Tax=uncultured Desulfobacter sp. TaxID=240139 RepID=UPI002AAAB9EA|nr:hypothetical protein [uncultured Desulfobacter sp.]